MKYLIINADDFGMSREVNEGIKKAIRSDSISSVSVMVNMPYFKDAVAFLKRYPEVSVGLHFNITEGSPLSQANTVETLIKEDGNFFYWVSQVLGMFTNQVKEVEIERELSLQYEKLRETGLNITHIDSHHHIHLYPKVFKVLVKFAAKNKVRSLRSRVVKFKGWFFSIRTIYSLKQFIILTLCYVSSRNLGDLKPYNEIAQLYDISWDKSLSETHFINTLKSLPEGITEIIVHPALISSSGNRKFLVHRYKCLNLILSPRVQKAIRELQIRYIKRDQILGDKIWV